jgi:hypothetical protein
MKYETAGDPISGLLWTRKTREKISNELAENDIKVGATTVGNILRKLTYSLKCNCKKVSNGGRRLTKEEKKTRDEQFKYIAKMRSEFVGNKLVTISVDAKKKELIGNFKNPGTRYKKESDLVNDHDFNTYAKGKAFLYGLFDEQRYEGFVYVGQSLWDQEEKRFLSSETPEFAAESIAKYWRDYGIRRYPNCNEILILADAGGSNGYRSRMWKFAIYQQIATKFGMKVTVCHYPPGASKWNPIEHKLFSEISKNWKGTPLRSFETVVNYARTTKTKTGLSVAARLVTKSYRSGKSIAEEDFKKIRIRHHDVFPQWNYTIFPGR